MRRREFISLVGGTAASLAFRPQTVFAQASAKRPLIGYLAAATSSSVMRSATQIAFINGLREHGYLEGRDVDIAYRFSDGFLDRLPALAAALVRLKPDAILAPATITAQAVRAATTTIPIVSPLLENPVPLGLMASENRPGGNVTGLLRYVDGLAGKLVELARELMPGVTRVAVLMNATNSDITVRRDVEAAASAFAVKVVPVEVSTPNELAGAFQRVANERAQVTVVLADTMFFSEHRQILTLAAANRLPTVWSTRIFAENGGVLSYGIDEADSFRRAATYVAKILQGAKAGDLPVELPVKFELIINLKTAKALGLTVPPVLLARADEVIE